MLSWRLVLVSLSMLPTTSAPTRPLTSSPSTIPPSFWQTLDGVFPRRAEAETWLRRHGDRLHQIRLH